MDLALLIRRIVLPRWYAFGVCCARGLIVAFFEQPIEHNPALFSLKSTTIILLPTNLTQLFTIWLPEKSSDPLPLGHCGIIGDSAINEPGLAIKLEPL